MTHNCEISTQATPWLKKIDSQTIICKILLSLSWAGFMPAQKKCSTSFCNNVAHAMPWFGPFGLRTAIIIYNVSNFYSAPVYCPMKNMALELRSVIR